MVIALAGLPRVGKDTFANYCVNTFPNVVTYSFALPFKKALCEMFGWTMEEFEDDTKDLVDSKYGISPREAMEFIGSKVMRGIIRLQYPEFNKRIGESIWTNRAEDFIKANEHKTVIITDLRFLVEYEMLVRNKATLVEVKRSNFLLPDILRCYDIPKMKFDLTIDNDEECEIEHYTDKVHELVAKLIY